MHGGISIGSIGVQFCTCHVCVCLGARLFSQSPEAATGQEHWRDLYPWHIPSWLKESMMTPHVLGI